MKKNLILFIIAAFIFISCKKDSNEETAAQVSIRYQFTSDLQDVYNFKYVISDTLTGKDSLATKTWTKTINLTKPQNAIDTTSFSVSSATLWDPSFQPAHVNLRIFINNIQKADITDTLAGSSTPAGLTAKTAF